ncbi:MAG: 16S rRNA (uracil(1498)-N(3))-methyltransferase [Paludibacter sp.]|nr:16S rRNA (uracil(1498)-N(3))-methyltransferase [Paludibacter sp.]
MTLFYVPNLRSGTVLSEEESLHAVKVLRLQNGDEIAVVDGAGGYYKAKITNPHPKHCVFEITESLQEYGKRNYKLHIAIAPTKNIERLEWFIEKATEIGVDEITPIICRFSERKIVKAERLEKIIVSAAKQSVKAYFPRLNPQCTFDELIKNTAATQKFIAHCYTAPQPSETCPACGKEREIAFGEEIKKNQVNIYNKCLLKNELNLCSNVLILIGPEGDFSKDEVEKAIKNGFIPVSLGESRLRTETAGVMACATVAITNNTL